MRLGTTNRYEEFITLRDEMRDLFVNSRQILYWTVGFVIAAFAWYVSPAEQAKVDLYIFTLFLLISLAISAFSFSINMNQIYRIGGYIAVFWDSRDTERGLLWHRFSRRSVTRGYLPNGATLIYSVLSVMITAFFIIFVVVSRNRPTMYTLFILLTGTVEAIIFTQMSRMITSNRESMETQWRELKLSEEEQREIHNVYEPPRLIIP